MNDEIRRVATEIVEDMLGRGATLEAVGQWLHLSSAPNNLCVEWDQAMEAWRARGFYGGGRPKDWHPIKHLEEAFGIKRPGVGEARRCRDHAQFEAFLLMIRHLRTGVTRDMAYSLTARDLNAALHLIGADKIDPRMVRTWWEEVPPEHRDFRTIDRIRAEAIAEWRRENSDTLSDREANREADPA